MFFIKNFNDVSEVKEFSTYKRHGYTIPFLNNKQFKELQKKENSKPKILGYSYLKEVDESSKYKKLVLAPEVDSSLEEPMYFKTKLINKDKKRLFFCRGYAYVGEGNYIGLKHSPLIPILLLFLLLTLCTLWGVRSGELPHIDFGGTPITEDEVSSKSKQESIAVPGFFDKTLKSEEDTIKFINPEENDVYFIYTVSEGDKVLLESKAIAPGTMVEASFYNQLSKGEHELKIDIGCRDMKTDAVCNGASEKMIVTIE